MQSSGWVISPGEGGVRIPSGRGAGGAEPPLPPPPQDYISLFPLDDTQPSKLMRLLSSNEEDANILSSPSKCRRGGRLPGKAPSCLSARFWV